jgi:hypothetical protein
MLIKKLFNNYKTKQYLKGTVKVLFVTSADLKLGWGSWYKKDC